MDNKLFGFRATAVSHHRNGIGGAPFGVVLFNIEGQWGSGPRRNMVGIVFDKSDYVAVLEVDKLASGDVTMGSNSWRGDLFEHDLREALGA